MSYARVQLRCIMAAPGMHTRGDDASNDASNDEHATETRLRVYAIKGFSERRVWEKEEGVRVEMLRVFYDKYYCVWVC